MFVVLEGIDACGKTEQAKLLADAMDAELFTFPDYQTPIGDLIHSHLQKDWFCADSMSGKPMRSDPLVFQCLHFANRLEMQPAIALALAESKSVVCDRYLASALAYGSCDGLDFGYLLRVQAYLIQPDVNILIDMRAEDSVERRSEGRDRYESNIPFLRDVALKYLHIWNTMGEGIKDLKKDTIWTVVDGRGKEEDIHEEILDIVHRIERLR